MAEGLKIVKHNFRPHERPQSLIFKLNEFIDECRKREEAGVILNVKGTRSVKWHLGETYWWYSHREKRFIGLKSYNQTPHTPGSFVNDWTYICKSLNGKLMIACGDSYL